MDIILNKSMVNPKYVGGKDVWTVDWKGLSLLGVIHDESLTSWASLMINSLILSPI